MENNKITGNEPAMPTIESVNHGAGIVEIRSAMVGLTVRQQFAMAAMQGMLANNGGCETESSGKTLHPNVLAYYAVKQADALIEELNK